MTGMSETKGFVTEDDYIVVGQDALKIIQQSNTENRTRAELAAREEISGYLRERYDVAKIFAAKDIGRNMQIVLYFCDIALYHMSCWLPGRIGLEIREKRYEQAIEWLEKVQAGKVMPELPTLTGPAGEEDYYNPIRYGAGQKNSYDW